MSDVVFFLKSMVPKDARGLDWPGDTKLIAVDPPTQLMCGGTDPRCSTAYSNLWSWLRDGQGRVMPNFLKKYAPGISVDRVAFVGFSAAHGFLNPLAHNPDDRARISAYLLLDATFGGGKTGYVEFGKDAVSGERLLVTTTSNTGGDESWQLVWNEVAKGETPDAISARAPMPQPSGGVRQLGNDLYWYRFVNANGGTELPHWEMHKVTTALIAAHLVPYWSGTRINWPMIAGTLIAVGGGLVAWRIYSR
jgi:hypothetical protein